MRGDFQTTCAVAKVVGDIKSRRLVMWAQLLLVDVVAIGVWPIEDTFMAGIG